MHHAASESVEYVAALRLQLRVPRSTAARRANMRYVRSQSYVWALDARCSASNVLGRMRCEQKLRTGAPGKALQDELKLETWSGLPVSSTAGSVMAMYAPVHNMNLIRILN